MTSHSFMNSSLKKVKTLALLNAQICMISSQTCIHTYSVFIKHSYMLTDTNLPGYVLIVCNVKARTSMSTLYKLKLHYLN